MAEFLSQLNSALESGLGRTRSFVVKFIISEQPKAVLACGCGGGDVDRGDIRCPSTINWMAGVIVAVSNMVNWSGVTSVDSLASPSASSEYALFAALSCSNTSPIFLHVDASSKLCPGNFFVNACVIISRSGTLVLSFVTFIQGGVGFKCLAITVISVRFLSVIVFITVLTLTKCAKFQTGMRASR